MTLIFGAIIVIPQMILRDLSRLMVNIAILIRLKIAQILNMLCLHQNAQQHKTRFSGFSLINFKDNALNVEKTLY